MKRSVALVMVGCMTLGMSTYAMAEEPKEEVVIEVMTYWGGEAQEATWFVPLIEEFNTQYEGEYQIELLELPNSTGYEDNISIMAQSNGLPVVIQTPYLDCVRNVIIPSELYYPMNDFYEAHPEALEMGIKGALEGITQENGDMVGMIQTMVTGAGLYYNSKLYQSEKNIRDMSAEEFLASLGDNKVAMHTGENAWMCMMLYSGLVGGEEGGAELLKEYSVGTEKLLDFNQPCFINAAKTMKELFEKYAIGNAIGATYMEGLNTFMVEESAFMFDGNWNDATFGEANAEQWPEGFDPANVAVDYYPGNVGLSSTNPFYGPFMITKNGTEEEIEGALEFMAYLYEKENQELMALNLGYNLPNVELSDDYYSNLEAFPLSYMRAQNTNADLTLVPSLNQVTYSSVTETVLPDCLSRLATGDITPEEFCQELSLKAQEADELSRVQ